jgi:hypothetical protein
MEPRKIFDPIISIIFTGLIPTGVWLVEGGHLKLWIVVAIAAVVAIIAWATRRWLWIMVAHASNGNPWIAGTYYGFQASGYVGDSKHADISKIPFFLSIHQNMWTEEVRYLNESRTSNSMHAGISKDSSGCHALQYSYRTNESDPTEKDNPIQMGLTVLELPNKGKETIKGWYINNRKYGGTMKLIRISRRNHESFPAAEAALTKFKNKKKGAKQFNLLEN